VDVASTNFHESAAVFGGRDNLFTALDNISSQYNPRVIGVATTCLAETIGDDVPTLLAEYRAERSAQGLPLLVPVSTASYRGTHEEGYRVAVRSMVQSLARADAHPPQRPSAVNILPPMVSPDDLRFLRRTTALFGLYPVLLPDYSDTMDGPAWPQYQRIPNGGTPLEDLRGMHGSLASIELLSSSPPEPTAGQWLAEECDVPLRTLAVPVGVAATDAFLQALADLAGAGVPRELGLVRGRLLDAYADAHKYLFQKRVVLYGERDLVATMARFCAEVGLRPVLCATGAAPAGLADDLAWAGPDAPGTPMVMEDADFAEIEAVAKQMNADLLIGNSNGAKLSRELEVPLVRVGMPVHDRFGAARIRTLGYQGTLQLFDRIVNALIEHRQERSPVGYTHM
jgi:nitrogenase molybdenum-iron protein NifN